MSSAAKTFELLTYFSATRPEIGLSQLCRLACRDKATTHRHLQDLEQAGYVEQNPLTKQYRLGPIVLQLAQTREVTVPRKSGAMMALSKLADATGETAHVSVLSGTTAYPIASFESPKHSTRAIVDIKTFPLHATASGLCALAFGPSELIAVATENMQIFTQNTIKTPDELACAIKSIRETGFGRTNRSFEHDICSVSAPIFDQTGLFAGAISVASVATRFTPTLEQCIQQNLITASRDITRNWGGTVPAFIEALWATSTLHTHISEIAS